MARILFVQNTFVRSPSLMLISAVAKQAGHIVDLIITNSCAAIKQRVAAMRPDIAAFSCITGNEKSLLPLARAAKEACPPVLTLWGGPHPTYFQDLIHTHGVDIICVGEGEYPTRDLLDSLDAGSMDTGIANLTFKIDGKIIKNDLRQLNDLDALPFADQYLYAGYPQLHNTRIRQIFTGRGCPHSCNFCFTTKQRELYRHKGKYLRKRSVENVIEEIKQTSRSFAVSMYNIPDDTFASDQNWALRFLDKAAELNIKFFVVLRFDEVTPVLAEKLAQAGCQVVIGAIETADDYLRNKVINKKLTTATITKAVAIIKSQRMKVSASNMLAFPGDTAANALNTVKLNIDLRIDVPMFFIFTPHPGTTLTRMALDEGLLDSSYLDRLEIDMRTVLLRFSKEDTRAFENIVRLASLTCRFPSLFKVLPFLSRLPLTMLYNILDRFCRVAVAIELGQFNPLHALSYALGRLRLDVGKFFRSRLRSA